MTLFARICLPAVLPALVVSAVAGPEPVPAQILKLTHANAIERALGQNFSIKAEEYRPQIATQQLRIQLGAFDPRFDMQANRQEDTGRFTLIDGVFLRQNAGGRVDTFSSGISGVTAWGTEYDLRERIVGQIGDTASEYNSRAQLQITQPLLRGAWTGVNLAGVRIARRGVKISEWQLRRRVIDVITQTDFVYNDLQLAKENLNVAIRSRELARQLLRDNEARVAIGVKSPLDVTDSRARVAARQEGVILAQRAVLDNENLLKALVTTDTLEMLQTRVEIDPPPSPVFVADVQAGIRDALELRPEYRQAILRLEQQKITVAVQKNALLPRVDLVGSLAVLGLDTDFGGSLSNIGRRDQNAWSAGVVFSFPLGNREASGNYHQARLEAARQLTELQALEQQIIVEIDNASGQILTSRERITSTREARQLARESLDAGEERLRAGTGTTFEVLELQERLATAEVAEVRAIADYNKAVAEYYRRTGTTLRVHHVMLD